MEVFLDQEPTQAGRIEGGVMVPPSFSSLSLPWVSLTMPLVPHSPSCGPISLLQAALSSVFVPHDPWF